MFFFPLSLAVWMKKINNENYEVHINLLMFYNICSIRVGQNYS